MAATEEQESASIMSLPDEILLLVMEKTAAGSGTMAVLRGFASARRRFQKIAHASPKLFEEPIFVAHRPEDCSRSFGSISECSEEDSDLGDCDARPQPAGDSILDVARLSARFGGRIERLHLDAVSCSSRIDFDSTTDSDHGGKVDRVLLNVLQACPNITHLSLSSSSSDAREHGSLSTLGRRAYNRAVYGPLAGLEELPEGFSLKLPRLRHLDLSSRTVPLPALRCLISACSASLECLFLRDTRVIEPASHGGARGLPIHYCKPLQVAAALERINRDFPHLKSLDLSYSNACADIHALRRLIARLPALRDLYIVKAGAYMQVDNAVQLAENVNRPGRLVIYKSLPDVDIEPGPLCCAISARLSIPIATLKI
eukprot:tig00020875_g14892.t1